jgi:hypothetical protein
MIDSTAAGSIIINAAGNASTASSSTNSSSSSSSSVHLSGSGKDKAAHTDPHWAVRPRRASSLLPHTHQQQQRASLLPAWQLYFGLPAELTAAAAGTGAGAAAAGTVASSHLQHLPGSQAVIKWYRQSGNTGSSSGSSSAQSCIAQQHVDCPQAGVTPLGRSVSDATFF